MAALVPIETQFNIKKFDGQDMTYRPLHFIEMVNDKMEQTHGTMPAARDNPENTAKHNQRLAVFSSWLSGPAKEWYRQKAQADREDWNQLITDFQADFATDNFRVHAQAKLLHMKRLPTESVKQFFLRVKEIATTAYQGQADEYRDGKIRDIFINGLDKKLRKAGHNRVIENVVIPINDLVNALQNKDLCHGLTTGSLETEDDEDKKKEDDPQMTRIENILENVLINKQNHTQLSIEQQQPIQYQPVPQQQITYGQLYCDGYSQEPYYEQPYEVYGAYDPGNYPRYGNQARKFCKICKRTGHTPMFCFQNQRNQYAQQTRAYSQNFYRPRGIAQGINRNNFTKVFTPTNTRGMLRMRPQGGNSNLSINPGTGMPNYSYGNNRFRGPQGPHRTITSGRPGSAGINLNPNHPRSQRPQGGTVDYAYRGGKPNPANAGPSGIYTNQYNTRNNQGYGGFQQHEGNISSVKEDENEEELEETDEDTDSSDNIDPNYLN